MPFGILGAMRYPVLLLALLLAPACGKKAPPPKPAPVEPAKAEPEKPAPPVPAEPPKDPEAPKKRAEAEAKVRELERALKEQEARHDQERKGLPEVSPLRRSYVQAIKDASDKQRQLAEMQERFAGLKQVAEGAASGKLKELRAERAKIKERQDAIEDAWAKSREDAATGTVGDSPVKKDLDLVRAVKAQWFAATPVARRGAAKESDRKSINDSFRTWLGEQPDRKRVVGQVLSQPLGPKGKTPDTYDFTELDFFILLALMEEQLERANIVVEKKELTEARGKLDEIQKELDAIDDKIREQMVAGGGSLEEYEDLQDRLPAVKSLASDLAERVAALQETLKQVDQMKERQAREEDEARAALDAAKKELARLR